MSKHFFSILTQQNTTLKFVEHVKLSTHKHSLWCIWWFSSCLFVSRDDSSCPDLELRHKPIKMKCLCQSYCWSFSSPFSSRRTVMFQAHSCDMLPVAVGWLTAGSVKVLLSELPWALQAQEQCCCSEGIFPPSGMTLTLNFSSLRLLQHLANLELGVCWGLWLCWGARGEI